MGRRLSNIEWATLMDEVNPDNLDLPPWGQVIDWHGLPVLLFQGADGEWKATDVSGDPVQAELGKYPKTKDPWLKVFMYELPAAVVDNAVRVAQGIEDTAKGAAKAVTSPWLYLALALVAGAFLLYEVHA